MGLEIDGELKSSLEAQVQQATVSRNVAVIMHCLDQETNKSKLRELLRAPIKEIRSHLGKEGEKTVLPMPVFTKVHDIVQGKA
eukprot:6492768-Amphidinium_carterae.1